MDRDQATETLRAVDGMRNRSIAEVGRASVFPLVVFGVAALVAAPFGELRWKGWLTIAMGVALLAAAVIVEIGYDRLPVHPAPVRKKLTKFDVILVAAIVLFFGPAAIGFMFALASSAASVPIFVVFTVVALIQGKRLRNASLALVGTLALLSSAVAPIVNADHWLTIAALLYGLIFLAGAAAVRRRPHSA
jgi:cytochrome c biogenesis protein CcdA